MSAVYLFAYDPDAEAWVKVTATADGKLIIDRTQLFENPPTEDLATKGPSSEWAFDHAADDDAHHAKYTDAEARAAINDLFGADGKADKDIDFDAHEFQKVTICRLDGLVGGISKGHFHYDAAIGAYFFAGKNTSNVYIDCDMYVYSGSAYKLLVREDKLQAFLALYLESSPSSGVTNKAPQSAWAYTHAANAAAHHAKYTDAEAVAAQDAATETISTGSIIDFSVSGKRVILLDTSSGDITLRGLSDGVSNQVIHFVKTGTSNEVYINDQDAAGTQKFSSYNGADLTLAAGDYGGFTAVYDGTYWQVLGGLA